MFYAKHKQIEKKNLKKKNCKKNIFFSLASNVGKMDLLYEKCIKFYKY